MSDIEEAVKDDIRRAEVDLIEAETLVKKLKLAGENVKEQEAHNMRTRSRVQKFKSAFKFE